MTRNLSVRGPSKYPTMLCPNPKCKRASKPLDNIKVLKSSNTETKDHETGEVVKVPHTATARLKVYCRHCKTPLLEGTGFFELKRVECVEKESDS